MRRIRSGGQTLRDIDRSLDGVRRQLAELATELEADTTARLDLQRQQITLYGQLATIRLDDLANATLNHALADTHAEVRSMLEARRQSISAVGDTVAAQQAALADAEGQRAGAREAADAAAAALDEAEGGAQAALAEDSTYQRQFEQARIADHRADGAEAKVAEAESDRDEKRKPYDEDPLFNYLWRRGYGTSAYRGSLLARPLDAWVARVCRYQQARPDYHRLLELPERLAEHAKDLRASADAEAAALQPLEQAAMAQAGVPELQNRLAESQQALTDIDEAITAAETTLDEALERQSEFVQGTDPQLTRCRALLTETLKQDSVTQLLRQAERTPTPEDDRVVDELAAVTDELADVEQSINELRREHASELQRLKELQSVRQRFRTQGYDGYNSGFINGAVLTRALESFLAGAASGNDVWDTLGRNRRHQPGRANPDFGSGRFPRAPQSWGRPSGSRLPGRSSGGFRTGGSF